MKLTVSEIPEEGLQLDINDIVAPEGITAAPLSVTAHLNIIREGRDVIISGSFRTVIETECVRCLGETKSSLDKEFLVIYHPSTEMKGDLELQKGDLEASFYANDEIDLKEMLEEQVVLHCPINPLCDEQCKGLCAKCGINLNLETCDCMTDETDNRWNALKNIKFERKD